jgi:pilus assembly protein Flp/PilA
VRVVLIGLQEQRRVNTGVYKSIDGAAPKLSKAKVSWFKSVLVFELLPCWTGGIQHMQDLTLRLYVKLQGLRNALKDENGQDMVEYAIVMGLIALGATAAMKTLATTIGTGFGNVGTKLTTYTS